MLDTMFSFHGRISRLQYFLGCLGLSAALGVLLVAAVFSLGGLQGLQGAGAIGRLGWISLLGVVVILGALWVSFALQAKRFRDIGWNPLYVIPGWITLSVFDYMLAHIVPALAIGRTHQGTMIGGLINLVLSCCLLFWPSAGDNFEITDDGDAPEIREAPPAYAAPSLAPVAFAANPNAARTTFGRRGI